MKHSHPITAKRPLREDFPTWEEWMDAWGKWIIDKAHAQERAERRKRWARERVFS